MLFWTKGALHLTTDVPAVECRNKDIKLMLVAPRAVKSKFIVNNAWGYDCAAQLNVQDVHLTHSYADCGQVRVKLDEDGEFLSAGCF